MKDPSALLSTKDLGQELVVLSTSEIRTAERAEQAIVVETADGPVRARLGDFIVSMPNGERYPIRPAIYFGSYEVVSVVGRWHVGRRLRHPRRAWPVRTAALEFDYGAERGVVSATRGAWLYQSDEHDFGLINEAAQRVSYAVVGTATELASRDWRARFTLLSSTLIGLPPVLIGISVLALSFHAVTDALLIVEALLLLLGAGAAWWSRRENWPLKAALVAGQQMARDYQAAVAALGLPTSDRFPMMTLWRAAQDDAAGQAPPTTNQLRDVKDLVDRTVDQLRKEAEGHHRAARFTGLLPWAVAFAMLACVPVLLATHHQGLKLFTIWLPSVLGAAHAWHWHRQVEQRAHAAGEMSRMLLFVKTRLVALAPREESDHESEVVASLRMLCLCVAQHSQGELCMAAAEEAHVPA
jgi:hypothetical protein